MIGIYTLIEKKHSLTYEKFIDITPYLANNSITEYYGKYFVNIDIEGTDYRDKFIISEFYLQTDTFIQAGINDTTAWLTNPAKFDTDDDGWSDYKEIYSKNTNPLSPDTDADHIWDPYDRDPHKDVMLKITPISASAPSAYNLQIVMAFTIDGSGDQYYIPTLKQKADVYEDPLWTAYYDGTHGSSTELHYYMNINDNKRLPNIYDLMRFDLELWHVDRYWGFIKLWDSKLHSGYDFYNIKTPGHSETLKIEKMDAAEQVIYEAKIKVETIGIEKTNTIAIYETNGSVFNDHYQEQERMNIIQLYVNDSGSGTPFEEGLNTIVIPTSLFTETVFNAYVQNETLNETKIYSSDEEIFKFISVGRDGNTEQACEEIDFVIIRFNISSQDAMEVLNLLLECLVNETTNETAIVYNYVSTKHNDTVAVMMNLPFSVLSLIPWYCDFEDSPKGSKPVTFEDWFWAPLIIFGQTFIGVFIVIGMTFVTIFMMIVNFFIEIFMEILPTLLYILWLIIRVILLVLIWITFAIIVLCFVLFIASLLIISIPLILLFGENIEYTINSVKVNIFDSSNEIGFNMFVEKNNFLGFWVPFISFFLIINETKFFEIILKFWLPEIHLNLGDTGNLGKSNLESSCFSNNSQKELSIENFDIRSSNTSQEIMNNSDALIAGLDDSFGSWSSLLLVFMSLCFIRDFRMKRALHVVILSITIAFAIAGYYYSKYDSEESFWYFTGTAIGCFITSGMFLYYAHKKSKLDIREVYNTFEKKITDLEKLWEEMLVENIVDVIELTVDIIGYNSEEFWMDIIQLAVDSGALVKSLFDWRETMRIVPYWAKLLRLNEDRDMDIALIALTPILPAVFLMIMADCAYKYGN
ncbi:MAG: hypothetical protein ACFFD7_01130 [Candidatus Thorarchaeota archaeon]